MQNLTTIIHTIDHAFTSLVFLPMLFLLYCRISSLHRRARRAHTLYRICMVLVILFLLRYFCAKFIFTTVNYPRFTESGLFPLIRAIFYSAPA